MTKLFKKFSIILIVSAVWAGIIFFLCGFTLSVPRGVTVNGESVGGKSLQSAAEVVRERIEDELKKKTLKIVARDREYTFTYPEIYYKDDLNSVLRAAKKGGEYTAKITYYLCGIDEVCTGICLNERIEKVEPYAEFKPSGEPFIYHCGSDGTEVDRARLKNDIVNSLNGDFSPVKLKYLPVLRTSSMDEVKENTRLLATFTTEFDGANLNRSSNIRLAAALINGVVVEGGNTFSFNSVVGERLPERGFKPAKIIENGEYVEGVGGGVCQVSTTLYNAALLSGMNITEYHPHSLAVGYVPPSRDAMVSGTDFDLKFKNPSAHPVYIRSRTGEGYLTFELYGKGDGATYSLESNILGAVPAEEEFCTDPALVREGSNGIISEGYLIVNRGGYEKRIKIRTDKYLARKRVTLNN